MLDFGVTWAFIADRGLEVIKGGVGKGHQQKKRKEKNSTRQH